MLKMEKCRLCLINDANKKGSHIVPHFLLKRIENIDSKTGRGYELGFTIEKLKATSYFGRSLQPEKLEEIYGEITDEDVDKNQHPLVVDNFFCSECEDKLGAIESEYSKTIEIIKENEYESGTDSAIGILFWASVLWRMSINGKSGVKLTATQNELLRHILCSFLNTSISEVDFDALNESVLVNSISYKLLRCNNCQKDQARWLFFHPKFYSPLCLLIDEFVLAFSFDGNFDDLETIDCLGINELIKLSPINRIGTRETVKSFDNSVYKRISTCLLDLINNVYYEGLDEFFNTVHVAAGGIGNTMPNDLKGKIMAELTSDEKKFGRRFTQEEIMISTLKVMEKYVI